jgi:virginiamycin B lyase
MLARCFTGFVLAVLSLIPLHAASWAAETAAALSGQVSSAEEGAMEGVVVSAKQAGSTITTSVVTDAQGHYAFPAARLAPGSYSLHIRAVGYELDGHATAEIAQGPGASVDLKLRKTRHLSTQLSNAEWLASLPGSDDQKKFLLNCLSCHTLERPLTSRHDAEEFVDVMKRMAGYGQMSTPLHPQRRLAELPVEDATARLQRQAEYLAGVNLSGGDSWEFPLKTLPRPKGRATRVVVTEYDLPRPTSEPHDVVVDADGIVWYSNFGEPYLSRLDPRTGKVSEYPVPVVKPAAPVGMLDLELDRDGNLWFGLMYQASIGKFDKKTEKVQLWTLPSEANNDLSQVNMVQPRSSGVDGKVWTQDNGISGLHRLDLASGKWETFEPFKDQGGVLKHNIYDVIVDAHNNAYFTDLDSSTMGRIDAVTGKITYYETPTPVSGTRRGMMDVEDRLWFAEYRGNRVGMLDTKSGALKEWAMPTPWTNPYDVTIDKNGELWTASMLSDRVVRLDPKSGAATEYLLPTETNVRRVFVDNRTTPVTFWVGSNHGAAVVKVEPMD